MNPWLRQKRMAVIEYAILINCHRVIHNTASSQEIRVKPIQSNIFKMIFVINQLLVAPLSYKIRQKVGDPSRWTLKASFWTRRWSRNPTSGAVFVHQTERICLFYAICKTLECLAIQLMKQGWAQQTEAASTTHFKNSQHNGT